LIGLTDATNDLHMSCREQQICAAPDSILDLLQSFFRSVPRSTGIDSGIARARAFPN